MEDENEKKPMTMRDLDYHFLQQDIEKAKNKKQSKEEVKEAIITTIYSILISLAILYFAHLDFSSWSIPVVLGSSLVSTFLFVTDERKNQTGHFFGIWLGLAAFTMIGCLVVVFILGAFGLTS